MGIVTKLAFLKHQHSDENKLGKFGNNPSVFVLYVVADRKLTQVFYLFCLILGQEIKGDHYGNDWQDTKDVFTRQTVASRDRKAHEFIAQHDTQMVKGACGRSTAEVQQEQDTGQAQRLSYFTGTSTQSGLTSPQTQSSYSQGFVCSNHGRWLHGGL